MTSSHIAHLGYVVDTSPLKRAERSLDDVTVAGKKTEKGIDGLTASVGILSAGLAALASATIINDVIRYSDSWNRVDNQLKIVITSESELISKRKELLKLSTDTNANLESTVGLYAELYRNTREMGASDEQLISVTKTLNNLFSAGAKDADTQAGAIRQLSQALGTGALRGDEFISVTEAAPRVMDALAQHLGIAKGELRDFAATGGITSEILVDALSNYSDQAQELANRTTKTFEQFTQNAQSNLTAYVGSSKAVLDATAALGGAIESASENIDAIVNGVITATSVMAAYALVVGGKSVVATASKTTANIALIKSEAALAASTLAANQAEVARLTLNKQSYASSIANIKSESIRNTMRMQLTKATIDLTAAEARLSVAQTAAAATGAKATTSAIALTGASRALGVAVNFALGPWGLLLGALSAAGIAYAMTDTEIKDVNDSLDMQADKLDVVIKKIGLMTESQKANAAITARFKLNDNLKEQADIEKQLLMHQFDSGVYAGETLAIQGRLNKLKEDEVRLNSVIDAANKPSKKQESNKPDIVDRKQINSLKLMREEIGLTSDELFVFRETQKSIANNDSAAMTAAITAQAEAIVKQRNAFEGQQQIANDYDEWIQSIIDSTDRAGHIADEINAIYAAMEGGDLDLSAGTEKIKQLQDELDDLNADLGNPFESMTTGAIDSLKAMQSLSAQGSDEYKKLGFAIEAVNAIQAVGAILTQGSGDPYSAFARMAGMAAIVASLGYSAGAAFGGGDFEDVAAKNQESQGLNAWGDKSESIANAMEITANATETLVGINTGMLKALTSVQNGIAKAAVLIGRDIELPSVKGVNTNQIGDIFGNLHKISLTDQLIDPSGILSGVMTGLFDKTIGKWFGGSSKVADEGIIIVGGQLNQMLDNVTVQAFQEVSYKKWKFGSTKKKTAIKDISNQVGAQFQLVLNSIADSVLIGATNLGLDSADVEKKIGEFQVATTKISTKGLSAEQQQKEIEAVFGRIFDDLSGSVIPWLKDLQQVGEGLGETLARVSTEVSIADIMTEQLGVNLGDKLADPELYAKVASNLSTLTGGVEAFAEQTSNFINNFATDATKLGIYQESLTESFESVGLVLPDTAAGMWDLMSSLDGTTVAGQEQIAMLLASQDQAAAYFDLIEKTTGAYRDAIDAMYDVSDAVSQMTLDAALAAARMGDFSLAEDLDLGSIAPNSSNFSSRAEYELARAETAAKLEELAQLTEGTISVDEKQLTTLEEIRDSIKGSDTMQTTEAIKELKEEMKTLTNIQINQARSTADTNALMQQMVIDGIPVRVES